MNYGKISIIVPVYNTSKYLEKCIESILKQSYRELEIILVNDCSTDKSQEIIDIYVNKDSRIKSVNHDQNKGLFAARLTGADLATGDYITFLDSDDYLGIDAYRVMLKKAFDTDSDIVAANMVMEYEHDQTKKIQTLNTFKKDFMIEGDEVYFQFFNQEGYSFKWHTVWNKIYSMELWKKARNHYNSIDTHLIMAEDLAYSAVLFYYANKVTAVEYNAIYYLQNQNASTSLAGGKDKFFKNINDLKIVFEFVENFLKEKSAWDKHQEKFNNWKQRYFKFWCLNIRDADLSIAARNQCFEKCLEAFGQNELIYAEEMDSFFYSQQVEFDKRDEELREMICDSNINYVSFDIFDTLIKRPFMSPEDLFYFVYKEVAELIDIKAIYDFVKIRKLAEENARLKYLRRGTQIEDIKIEQIYDELAVLLDIDKFTADKIMQVEKELEIRFCVESGYIKEIYELVLSQNKKVIFTSDMYLDKKTIEAILSNTGYNEYYKLYLSSELGLSKHVGGIFDFILKDLCCKPKEILHMGDSWHADNEVPSRKGLNTFFYPKAIEQLFNILPDKQRGDSTNCLTEASGHWVRHTYAVKYMLNRCALAVVANNYFDNPFRPFSEYSDFNGDYELIGMLPLGLHSLGLMKWLMNVAEDNNYNTLHFAARDGYLPMQCYNIVRKFYPELPESNYLYLSRKAALPCMINSIDDLYLFTSIIEVNKFSPEKICKLFLKVELDQEEITKLRKYDCIYNKNFSNQQEYVNFVNAYKIISNDFSKNEEYAALIKKYLAQNKVNCQLLFDIGYDGTSQMMMAELGFKMDACYVHTKTEKNFKYIDKYGFEINTFYDYTPAISGGVREYMFSSLSGSCIGYKYDEVNRMVVPIIESKKENYIEHFVMDGMFEYTTKFIERFLTTFEKEFINMETKSADISAVFDTFLNYPKEYDRNLFQYCGFEDELYWGEKEMSIKNLWEFDLKYFENSNYNRGRYALAENERLIHLESMNRFNRIIFFIVCDRKTLKDKIYYKTLDKPMLHRQLRKCYRLIKKEE